MRAKAGLKLVFPSSPDHALLLYVYTSVSKVLQTFLASDVDGYPTTQQNNICKIFSSVIILCIMYKNKIHYTLELTSNY